MNLETHAPAAADDRDYLAEAQAIAKGASVLLAQREHVDEALRYAESIRANLEVVSRILAAIVLDQLQPGREPVAFIPKAMTDDVETRRIGVLLEQTKQGTVVHVVLPTPKHQRM